MDTTVRGSGTVITEHMDLAGFSGLHLGHTCKARITQGNTHQIEVKLDDNIKEYLIVEKEGDTLKVTLEPGHRYRGITFEANITLPDLSALRLSGASSAHLSGFAFDHPFFGRLSGASRLSGSLNAGDLDFKLSGASHLVLKGQGANLGISASGASSLDLGKFMVNNVRLGLSGASRATVHITGRLDGSMSGASRLLYYGNPTLGHLSSSGASRIEKIG
jgi:hypothetical protein